MSVMAPTFSAASEKKRSSALRQIGFWFAVALVIGLSALSYQSIRMLVQANRWVDHTQTILLKLEDLSSALKDAEIGQRGYLLTRSTSYLEPYDQATRRVAPRIAEIRQLTADNPAQQRQLVAIEALVKMRLQLLDQAVQATRNGLPFDRGWLDRGKNLMDQIRNGVDEMAAEEGRLYRLRQQAATTQARHAITLLWVGTANIVLLLGLVFYLMNLEVRRRGTAEREITLLNAGLQERVRAATAELGATKTFLDTVIENIPAMLVVKDAKDLRFMLLNRTGEQLLGIQRGEFIGKSDFELFPPEEAERFVTRDRAVLESRSRQVVPEQQMTTRHKGVRLLRTTKVPVLDEDGTPRFLVVLSEDITDSQKVEQQLHQAQRMEAVGQLSGGIAHDFNNILGSVIGNLDLLRERLNGDADAEELATDALDSALRGAELTKRLLAFGRRQNLQPKIIDLNEGLEAMATILRRTLGEHIALTIDPSPDLWSATADPAQVQDAILNLAINARDAMPAGGRLLIESRNVRLDADYASENPDVTPGEYVMLAVTDSGTGMSREILERVLEPFFTTKEAGRGTGLGLSMVYGFVKQSRGHLKIYSELDHGTSVKLYLPRAIHEGVAVPAFEDQAQEHPRGAETVLVVEDDVKLRKVAKRILGDLGYHVLEAEDGAIALGILRENAGIDLLFSDVVMPNGVSGYDLASQAKALRPDIKVVLTTGYSEAFVRSGDAVGDIPLIGKPYRKEELADKLRSVLDEANGHAAPAAHR